MEASRPSPSPSGEGRGGGGLPCPLRRTALQQRPMTSPGRLPRNLMRTPRRDRSGWRRLLWFWVCILSLAAVGGAALQYAGPPPPHVQAGLAPPSPPRAVAPPARPALTVVPAPSASSTASAPLATSAQPVRPEPEDPQTIPRPGQALGQRVDVDAAATAPAPPPPPSRALVVVHPGRTGEGQSIAYSLADQIGLAPDQVAVGEVGEARRSATIRFFRAQDHAFARRVGQELAKLGMSWQIENRSDRQSPRADQAIEVWLPAR